MQILASFGIGILGLASAAATLDLAEVGPTAPQSTDSLFADGAEEPRLRVVHNKRIWYNTRWSDVLHIDGEWEEIQRGETVVLRPAGEDCNIGISLPSRKEIHYLPVDSRGEVTFAGGWIKVNQVGQSNSESVWGEVPINGTRSRVAEDDECDFKFNTDDMAHLETDGDCWEQVQTGEECDDYWVCGGTEEGEGCELEFAYVDIRMGELGISADCGSGMGFSVCESGPGEDWFICIWLE